MSNTGYQDFFNSSQLTGGNFTFLEELYEDYLHDPNSVTEEWRHYFAQLPTTGREEVSIAAVRDYFSELAKLPAHTVVINSELAQDSKQYAVYQLINNYRALGHRQAHIDPLNLTAIPKISELQLNHSGLTQADLMETFTTGNFAGLKQGSLKDIIAALEKTYCGNIGLEVMHITDSIQRQWLLEKFESNFGQGKFSKENKLRILDRLIAADGLERYLHNKYVGQKRFSLEGGDTFIPLLDQLVQSAATKQVDEVVIGMAHRGRLNVMVNILGQAPQVLFDKFEGKHDDHISGDVKYHLGISSDIKVDNKVMHLALAFNPSHLEIISPVAEGNVRAKQDYYGKSGEQHIIPVLVHGDASFAGQGVVMETFNLSQVAGYKTGGTVHIIINNQVGFTTDPLDDRSTPYCTDIAKMVEAPIFHVNGEDPEAAVFAMQLAFEFRMKFNRDVVIDLVCYRRHGHNEADEPSVTQPLLYKTVKAMPITWTQYAKKLEQENVLVAGQSEMLMKEYQQRLALGKPMIDLVPKDARNYKADWQPYLNKENTSANTIVNNKTLQALAEKLTTIPAGYALHSRVAKIIEARTEMARGKLALDWGFAETLAYATLLAEGHNVRISGQDAQRGTFFHRHAVLHNIETGEKFIPLRQVAAKQGRIDVINSTLSEEAVMGFDMGYAMATPNDLTIWEAQFGDFANGAQVIVDQFLSSMEQKWDRYCGLTLLLPHGQEGAGPEHSSARLERYLQLCAQNNMYVCQPTTPAQLFHMLRRQVVAKTRKPLIVMTPKSLLRHKLVVSTLNEFEEHNFQLLIPEVDAITPAKVDKVIVCSGKIYYDLLEQRQANKQNNVAIIRIEQLYPFPAAELMAQLNRYTIAKKVVWCQEEAENQGAWYTIKHNLEAALAKHQTLEYVGPTAMAAPAVGYLNTFTKEQERIVIEALK